MKLLHSLALAAVVALLYFGHGAHLLQLAPFLILLACPLMHVFGHGGHGGHSGRTNRQRGEPAGGSEPARPASGGGHVH